jgi:hypothetical protein
LIRSWAVAGSARKTKSGSAAAIQPSEAILGRMVIPPLCFVPWQRTDRAPASTCGGLRKWLKIAKLQLFCRALASL